MIAPSKQYLAHKSATHYYYATLTGIKMLPRWAQIAPPCGKLRQKTSNFQILESFGHPLDYDHSKSSAKGGRTSHLKGRKHRSQASNLTRLFSPNNKISIIQGSDQNDRPQHSGHFGITVSTEIFCTLSDLSKDYSHPDAKPTDHGLGHFLATLSPNLHRDVSFSVQKIK